MGERTKTLKKKKTSPSIVEVKLKLLPLVIMT
jgi:hypothetical protein